MQDVLVRKTGMFNIDAKPTIKPKAPIIQNIGIDERTYRHGF